MKRWVGAALVVLSVMCALAPMAAVAFATRVHASHCLTPNHHSGTVSPQSGHVGQEHIVSGYQQEITADNEHEGALECCGLMCFYAVLTPAFAIVSSSVSVPARWHRNHVASRMTGRLDRPPNPTLSC